LTLVIDASVVVAALVDDGQPGAWAESLLVSEPLAAPHLLHAEVANILRRAELHGDISADTASLAHGDLLDLRVELYPYGPLAERVWTLRDTVTAYDAWYIALAEHLSADLATLDHRLTRAAGPTCGYRVPS
jgi:predicted nucleic acid-binding protein